MGGPADLGEEATLGGAADISGAANIDGQVKNVILHVIIRKYNSMNFYRMEAIAFRKPCNLTLLLTFLLTGLATVTFAQHPKETTVKSIIKEATVFLKGGNILRTSEQTLAAGKQQLVFKGLSAHIDNKTVKVKGYGDFTILNINHRKNYLELEKKSEAIEALNKQLKVVKEKQQAQNDRLLVLKQKESLLQANKNLSGENRSATLAQIDAALKFYDTQLTSIYKDRQIVQKKLWEINKEVNQLQKQINAKNGEKIYPTSEIVVEVEAKKTEKVSFEITYFLEGVSWFPKYDVRIKDIKSPVNIEYKASFIQNTGVNWKNVKLKFSSGNPGKGGQAPKLDPWYLYFGRNSNPSFNYKPQEDGRQAKGVVYDVNGQPIPGASILVYGTSIGTTTDMDGNYSLTMPQGKNQLSINFLGYKTKTIYVSGNFQTTHLQQNQESLEEVVVTSTNGRSKNQSMKERSPRIRIRGNSTAQSMADDNAYIETSKITNQTSVEFVIDKPYTAPSSNTPLIVDLAQYKVPANYSYFVIPKLEKEAFLTAEITDFEELNLIEGESNLYFEEGFVGKSILGDQQNSDTLRLSLGRDKSIQVSREKLKTFTSKKYFGSNKIEKRGFQIKIKNNKSEAINIIVKDQVPVSTTNTITVKTLENSGAKEEKQGLLTWTFKLPAKQEKKLDLQYEVKYPKFQTIILE